MTHFVVTVCVRDEDVQTEGLQAALEAILAPYSEELVVEPYRDYEKSSPTEFWWTKSVRHGADNWAQLMQLQPGQQFDDAQLDTQLDIMSLQNRARRLAIERLSTSEFASDGGLLAEADVERAADGILKEADRWRMDWQYSQRLGEQPTWPQIIALYDEYYDHDAAEGTNFYDEELDKIYTMSTYNPLSKWDWWTIGGRWQDSLISTPFAPEESLVRRTRTLPAEAAEGRQYCDGGQVHALDFEFMRAETTRKGLERYDAWAALVDKHGQPEPWQELMSKVDMKELSIQVARQRYNDHPAIRAARGDFGKNDGIVGWFDCPEEVFGTSREEFEQRERDRAMIGYALVTLEGNWTAPGEMGWFAMSSDGPGEAEAFKVQANKYLNSLSADTWIVNVDCHI